MKMKYRNDIQVLRAFSILLVVLYHLQIPGFQQGFLGVDIFFVISGYLMVGIYSDSNWKNFYQKRLKKLFPAYLITIILTIIYAFKRAIYPDFLQVIKQSIFSIFLIPNLYFAEQTGYFETSTFRPLLHLWSLGVEFQFYIFFPLLIKLIYKRKWLVFIGVFSFTLSVLLLLLNPKISFYVLPARLWEFLFGMLAFKALDSSKKIETNLVNFKYLSIFLVMVITIFIVPIDEKSHSIFSGHPGILTLIVVVLTASLIKLGSEISLKPNLLLGILKLIGDNSYFIYLTHYPLLVFLGYAPLTLEPTNTEVFDKLPIALLLIVMLTTVLYYSNRIISKRFAQNKVAAVLFLVITVLFAILPTIRVKQLSVIENRIYQSRFDRGDFRCGKFQRVTYQFVESIKGEILFCKISRNFQSRKILLLGDSHADAIKSEMIHLANSKHINLYLNARNHLPLSDLLFKEQLVRSIVSNRFTGVIMHFSPTSISPIEIYSLSESLSSAGIESVILSPVPVWKIDIPKMLIFKDSNNYGLQSQTYTDYLKVNAAYFESNSFLKLTNDNFVDIGKFMCRPECQISNPMMDAYYWDSSHLTLKGAEFLRPVLDYAFGKVT
jgi:peptidoglycan/LPS O-acetylase OafA/YrhL